MRKMRIYRFLSAALALSLGVCLLSGCSGAQGGGSENGSSGKDGQTGTVTGENAGGQPDGSFGSGEGASEREGIPMGRYVEEELSLPETAGQLSYITMLRGRDGRLELYLRTPYDEGIEPEAWRYIRNGSEWQEDAEWHDWLSREIVAGEVSGIPEKVTYGQDGHYYFTAPDDDYVYHLYRVSEDGSVLDLFPEVFLPKAGKAYGLIPSQIDVAADGKILIHDMDYIYCYGDDGTLLFTMDKISAVSDTSVGYIEGEEFVTITDKGVTRYSLANGEKLETISYDESIAGEYGESNELFGDGNGGIYMANRKGLVHVNRGGSLWEQMIDGKLNSMGRESKHLSVFLAGDENDFYACFTSGTLYGISICRYTYDPDMVSVPLFTLTVYSLRDNSTIRQAASVFQESHPDVLVDVRTVAEQREEISEETIRALNTEILNGKGADVLVLDGLPADAYVSKGVLMDLREVFSQIQEETPLLKTVAEDFTEPDGAVYQMPSRITIPVVTGLPEAVHAWESLEGIRDYQGEKPLQHTRTYENLLRQIAVLHYQELFGTEGLTLDHSRLLVYLEAVKALGQSCGAKAPFTEEEQNRYHIGSTVSSDGISGTGLYFDAGLADSGMDKISEIMDFGYQEVILENHPEAAVDSIGGIYFPVGLVGVNQATANPQLAREFVKCVFSVEVQKENLNDGFPVNREGLDSQFAVAKSPITFGLGFPDWDYSLSAGYPGEESRARLSALLDGISQPVIPDETLMKMIVAGAMDYCEDRISAEQAASAIEQQVLLYQAERG